MSSILNNHLIVLSAVISIFVILFPATKGSNEYIDRFKIAVILTTSVGLIFGILKSMTIIIPNGYFHYGMHYLILRSLVSIVDKYFLLTLGVTLFVFITLALVQAFLKFIHANKRVSDIIIAGIVPSLLIFTIGGYWINRLFLPGFFELKSVVGNVIWAVICLLLVWLVGQVVFKMSRREINFSTRMCNDKTLVSIVSLVVLFNIGYYLYFRSLNTDRPNLILISIDTLRADHLSCYGYSRTTPNFDRFAKDSVLFKNTIAQASWTLPSHMSMLTGLYSSSHGVILSDRKLNDEHLTMAEILQNTGYKTVAFTDGGYLSQKYGHQGFDHFEGNDIACKVDCIEPIYTKTVSWLRKSNYRPFFLFLHTYQVHAPFDPPPAYDLYSDKNYAGIIEVSGNSNDYYENIKSKMTTKDRSYVIDKYDGEIYYTDHFLGKLFDELKALGLYENSIIVVTSDHGENFLDHTDYAIHHVELYDEILRVPLIIKAPAFPSNRTIEEQVKSIDIMPTVLEILGIPVPHKIDGESLVGLVKEGSHGGKVFAFSEKFFPPNHQYDEYKMIRTNDWKLILRLRDQSRPLKIELYNLQIDPKEENNLFSQEGEIGKSLFGELRTWMSTQEKKSYLSSSNKIKLDKELSEQLKALGYIN